MLRKSKWFIYSLIIILINVALGHFLPPSSIMFSPIVICVITVFVMEMKINTCVKTFLIGFLISLQDIGVKLFAGGTSDSQGLAWIHLMLLIGVASSGMYLLYYMFYKENSNLKVKLISLLILGSVLLLHLRCFFYLGLEVK
ncbi:hypothetical protein [Pseudofulvibacter geojedonensis]|uniref:Rod shape-determining protein MreD n=1 Tax=Pseudofulvibacter geojedonensis TaxID=1123758 RepID=A0ABW3I5B4_9FLAO